MNAAPPPLRSALYECRVTHQRLAPKRHGFRYRMFYFALDLAELDEIPRRVWGFRHNRRHLYEFRDRDHLVMPGLETAGIRANLAAWLASQGTLLADDARVTFVTMVRMLGYVFNPVSFFFVSDAAGTPTHAVVQVGNTFGELKPYLLAAPEGEGYFRLVTPKHFYVSPFSDLNVSFDFRLHVPDANLKIHIDDRDGDDRLLISALTGRRVPLTTWNLCKLTAKSPLITLKVIAMIHWEAFRLWWKKIPFHRKGANPSAQRGVFRPHTSLEPRI
jgi:uncharacterized protein